MARVEGHFDIFTGRITAETADTAEMPETREGTVEGAPLRVSAPRFEAEKQYGTAGGWLRGLRGADLRARGQSRGGVGLSGGWR